MLRVDPQDKARLIDPLYKAGPGFWLTFLALGGIVGWGVVLYVRQVTLGLTVTGMDRPNYWGIYIVNFIFLIGVSMAGTVITAVLHLTGVNWRRPISRIAEATTVFGLMVAGLTVIVDMGRPDRMLYLLLHGRAQSPLLWDVASLTMYLLTSSFALFISVIPDLGVMRDNLPEGAPRWRRILYTTLSLGWRGNREQWRRLESVMRVVSILIIPIGVSLHTVTSWILSTTLQPGWHSTILGPYFVVGAIFSGIGLLIILVTIMRVISPVKFYVEPKHYRNLGWIFITMSIVWFYFTYTEHLTLLAGQDSVEFPLLASKLWGNDALTFWGMVILMIVATYLLISPLLLPSGLTRRSFFRPRFTLGLTASAGASFVLAYLPQTRAIVAGPGEPSVGSALRVTGILLILAAGVSVLAWLKRHVVAGSVVAAVAVVVGMWLERWNIIIPTVTHPRMIQWTTYAPSLTEWSLTAATVALFCLMLLVFFKLIPAVSLWEVAEGRVIENAQAKIDIPMPPESVEPKWQSWKMPRRLS